MAACLVSGRVCTLALAVLAYAVGRTLHSTQRKSSLFCFTFWLCLAAALPCLCLMRAGFEELSFCRVLMFCCGQVSVPRFCVLPLV